MNTEFLKSNIIYFFGCFLLQSKLVARKLKTVHISLRDVLEEDQTSDGNLVGIPTFVHETQDCCLHSVAT